MKETLRHSQINKDWECSLTVNLPHKKCLRESILNECTIYNNLNLHQEINNISKGNIKASIIFVTLFLYDV